MILLPGKIDEIYNEWKFQNNLGVIFLLPHAVHPTAIYKKSIRKPSYELYTYIFGKVGVPYTGLTTPVWWLSLP